MSESPMSLGINSPRDSCGMGGVEAGEAGVGSRSGKRWFLSRLALAAVSMTRAKTAASLHATHSMLRPRSPSCSGQCGVKDVLAVGVLPAELLEGVVFGGRRGEGVCGGAEAVVSVIGRMSGL